MRPQGASASSASRAGVVAADAGDAGVAAQIHDELAQDRADPLWPGPRPGARLPVLPVLALRAADRLAVDGDGRQPAGVHDLGSHGFWDRWLLGRLAASGDQLALPAYEYSATRLKCRYSGPQEASQVLCRPSRGMRPDPARPLLLAAASENTHAAWEQYGAIIFWLHRPGSVPDEASARCEPRWQHLRTGRRSQAGDDVTADAARIGTSDG